MRGYICAVSRGQSNRAENSTLYSLAESAAELAKKKKERNGILTTCEMLFFFVVALYTFLSNVVTMYQYGFHSRNAQLSAVLERRFSFCAVKQQNRAHFILIDWSHSHYRIERHQPSASHLFSCFSVAINSVCVYCHQFVKLSYINFCISII